MHRPSQDPDARLVVVVFWRREGTGIKFFFPIQPGYLDTMGRNAAGNSGIIARTWAERSFGFNPRANGLVFVTKTGVAVAFTLNATEARQLDDRGKWLPVGALDPTLHLDGFELLTHVESRLEDA